MSKQTDLLNLTDVITVDSSNSRVGIGTSSPSEKLTVAVPSNSGGALFYGGTQSDRGLKLSVSNAGGFDNSFWYLNQTANNSGSTLAFGTRNAEAMRIDASGRLLVSHTSNLQNAKLEVSSNSSHVSCFNANSIYHHLARFQYASTTNVGSITTNGSSTAYNTTSDYRLKTDAQPMTGASARVQALNPVNFEWIADGTRVDGFLAHEAQEIVPEAVVGAKDEMRDEQYEVTPAVYEDVVIPAVLDEEGNELEAERTEQRLVSEAVMGTRQVPDYQGIDQSKLVPLLTAALQEALTEIADLKARVAALEAV